MPNPVVKVRPVRRGGFTPHYVVWCMTGDCEFADVAGVKTGAQTLQREHARKHRSGTVGGGR